MKKNLIFDLDQTLYPLEMDPMPQFMNRMFKFLTEQLLYNDAKLIQFENDARNKYHFKYWRELLDEYKISAADFLEYVCTIDVSCIPANQALAELLAKLPQKKYIFSDSPKSRITACLQSLQISENTFEGICDCHQVDCKFKYNQDSFTKFLAHYQLEAKDCIMFEDSKSNLAIAKGIGMTTVLITKNVTDESFIDYQFPDVLTAVQEIYGK